MACAWACGARKSWRFGRRKTESAYSGPFSPTAHSSTTPRLSPIWKRLDVSVLDPEAFGKGLLNKVAAGAIVVIRAHGAPPEAFERLARLGARVIDATCPRVLKSQKKAKELLEQGYSVVIAGDRSHGEVAGILGHAPGAEVVENAGEAEDLARAWAGRPVALIAQTTIKKSEYDAILEKFSASCPNFLAVETLCPATSDRQKALAELAGLVDAIVVVGGKNSANTKRLWMAARESGKPAWHIETAAELSSEIFFFRENRDHRRGFDSRFHGRPGRTFSFERSCRWIFFLN